MSFILNIVKPFIGRWINGHAGGVIQNAVGAALGYSVKAISEHLGVEVPISLVEEINLAAVGIGMFVVTTCVQYWQTGKVQQIQSTLGVPADGYIGPVTIRRAERVVE